MVKRKVLKRRASLERGVEVEGRWWSGRWFLRMYFSSSADNTMMRDGMLGRKEKKGHERIHDSSDRGLRGSKFQGAEELLILSLLLPIYTQDVISNEQSR